MLTRRRLLRVVSVLFVMVAALFALLVISACGDDESTTGAAANSPATSGAAPGEPVALHYTYNAGDTWAHEILTVTKATTEGMGDGGAEPTPTDQTTTVLVTTTVKEVVDGVATLSMVYQTVESTVDGEAQTLDDSYTQEITMKVDTTGMVVQDGATTTTQADALGFLSGEMFDPADFNNQFSILYPESGRARVGEQWTRTSTVPVPGMGQDFTVTTKATLKEVSSEGGRETATIDYETTIPLDMTVDLGAMFGGLMGGGTEAADPVFAMSIKGNLAYAGTAHVDRATGQTITSDSTATNDFEMNITDAPEDLVPLDQRGPFASHMDLTVAVNEVEPGAVPTTSTRPSSSTGETTLTSEAPALTQAADLSSTIVLPAGWAMTDALTAADVEAVIGRTGYTAWPEPNSDAASGKPAGSFYDGSNIDTKIMFRAYTPGGAAEYERLAGFVLDPQEVAADLWDKLIVGDDKFATDPLITALILRGDVCMSIQWRPEQYSDIDPLDLAVGLADMFVTRLFTAR